MKSDLIERYIYAVEKRLPYKQRADIKKELHTLISDMLEQRCGNLPPTEHDVRVVLTELGTPGELAEKYNPDKYHALIGQPYYGKYKMVLKIVMIAVAGGLTIASLLALLGEAPKPPFFALMEWFGGLLASEVYAFAFVTGLFAFFERKGVKMDEEDLLVGLPPVPKKDERISRGETVVGILFSLLFLILFLWLGPWIMVIYNGSEVIPLFNQAALLRMWPVILLMTGIGITKEIIKMLEGRYTFKVAIAALITGVLDVGLLLLLFSAKDLINPAFMPGVMALFGAEDAVVYTIFANFPTFFFGVVVFAHVLEIATAFTKAFRYRKAEA